MSKVRFLTKDDRGRKLKRNVPAKLVELAGKTAWVERLGNLPYAEAKARSNTFAVWTDAGIRRLAEATRAAELLELLEAQLLAKAFRGKLVPQDPADEPASALLARIREARAAAPKPKRTGKRMKEA